MENELYDNLKALNADVDDLVETVEKIPAFVVKKVKESEEKTIKNLKKLDEKISKVKTIQGKQGEKGDTVNGKDGYTPIKGLDYFDGKDGSPDTPTEIKTKLESLQGDDRLDASAIKGSENALTNEHFNEILKAVSSINNVRTAMVNAAERGIQSVVHNSTLTGLGTTASPLAVVGGSPIDDTQIAVRVATTAALAGSPVYANGSSGVGATLTRGTNGVLPSQDGVSLEIGDRILVKNQASTLQNGIYEVTSLGSASTKWVLTRTTDADSSQELDEMIVAASEGTTNRAISYGQQTNNPTIGTSAITFTAAPSVALSQATTGTQAINQIPIYTGTARQVTRGTSAFKYDPITNIITINSGNLLFPTSNSAGLMTNDGIGNLSYTAGTTLTDGDKGDITVSSSGATWTVDTNAITFSKLQQLTTLTVFGNSTGSTANATAVPFSTISPIQKGTNTNNIYSAGLTGTGQGGNNSIIFGASAGSSATSNSIIAIGQSAAATASGTATNLIAMGQNAMSGSTGTVSFAVAIGRNAGTGITSTGQYGVFIGDSAGNAATGAFSSVFIGQGSGLQASATTNGIFLGTSSGYQATTAIESVFIGYTAGYTASNARNSNFVGLGAGNAATNASYSIFSGYRAGSGATNAKNTIFIGQNAGFNDTVNNTVSGSSIAIGDSAGTGGFQNSIALGGSAVNTKANQFMIGSSIDTIVLPVAKTPSSASDTGTTGTICWDSNYVYVCVATDTWKRSAIATW